MMKRVTLKDIAEAAGVSIGTVDRAMNNRKGIDEEVRQRILSASREMGYVKNILASTLSKNIKKKVALIIPREPGFFWGKLHEGMRTAEKEHIPFGIEFIHYDIEKLWAYSEEQIIENIDKAVDEKADALVMVALNSDSIKTKIKEKCRDIPVVTINEEFDESINFLFHVGIDNRLSGRLAAELLCKFLRGKGNILVVINTLGEKLSFHQKRLEGFKSIIAESFPDIHILGYYSYDKIREEQYHAELLKSMIGHCASLDGIYDFDGASLYNIGNIVKELGKSKDIVIVGHEVSKEVAQLLHENVIHGVISQDPYAQGYEMIKKLCGYILKGGIFHGEMFYTNLEIILRENCRMQKLQHTGNNTGCKRVYK